MISEMMDFIEKIIQNYGISKIYGKYEYIIRFDRCG